MGLIARIAEARGIATVCVMNLLKVAERIRPPRTLLVEREFGAVLGPPGDTATQRATVCAALDLLESAERPGEIRALDRAGRAS